MSFLGRSNCCLKQFSRVAQITQKRTATAKQILGKNPPIPKSSPLSLQFEPGPVERARYDDFYHDVIAPDLLAMTYKLPSPGDVKPTKKNAMRAWDGSSPYHKGRPLRPLRGGKVLKPLAEARTYRNVPKIENVHVHTTIKEALEDRSKLLSVVMALQAITGEKPEITLAKKNIQEWKLRAGMPMGARVLLKGPSMNQFLATLFEIILPSLKDFTGLSPTKGDHDGNLAFGLPPGAMARFPEIEANYEQYPILPGFHVTINTTATNLREVQQLLSGFGLPFQKT